MKKSPTGFGKTAVFNQKCQNKWAIFSKFCGLFRKAGLYEQYEPKENQTHNSNFDTMFNTNSSNYKYWG